MFLFILVQPALLWFIMHFVFDEHSTPSFWPLVITTLIAGIVTSFISAALGVIAIIPNFLIFSGILTFLLKLDFKKTLISVGIFQGIMLIVSLLYNAMLS